MSSHDRIAHMEMRPREPNVSLARRASAATLPTAAAPVPWPVRGYALVVSTGWDCGIGIGQPVNAAVARRDETIQTGSDEQGAAGAHGGWFLSNLTPRSPACSMRRKAATCGCVSVTNNLSSLLGGRSPMRTCKEADGYSPNHDIYPDDGRKDFRMPGQQVFRTGNSS
jgi:hypothetical protein